MALQDPSKGFSSYPSPTWHPGFKFLTSVPGEQFFCSSTSLMAHSRAQHLVTEEAEFAAISLTYSCGEMAGLSAQLMVSWPVGNHFWQWQKGVRTITNFLNKSIEKAEHSYCGRSNTSCTSNVWADRGMPANIIIKILSPFFYKVAGIWCAIKKLSGDLLNA